MLLASLTRKRCAILQKGFVELPSNMGGVITIPFNSHVREAVPKLVQRLQDAGTKLDPSAIGIASWLSVRSLTPPIGRSPTFKPQLQARGITHENQDHRSFLKL